MSWASAGLFYGENEQHQFICQMGLGGGSRKRRGATYSGVSWQRGHSWAERLWMSSTVRVLIDILKIPPYFPILSSALPSTPDAILRAA